MSRDGPGIHYPWLDDALSDGGIVVTASRRLARALSEAWCRRQLDQGRQAWHTPAIHSWQAWLVRLLAAAADPLSVPRRLDPVAAAALWEQCLAARVPDDVLSVGAILRQAGRSWSRVQEWDVGVPALLATAGSRDEKLFAGAAADYCERLDAGNWVDPAGLGARVIAEIERDNIEPPVSLAIAGFDRQSPMVKRLLDTLSVKGCRVSIVPPPRLSRQAGLAPFEAPDAEFRAAGAWARQRLTERPGARIGIVCPALEQNARQVVRCVRDGLTPGWQLADDSRDQAVEVSYGRRLAEYPAVATALALLGWAGQGMRGKALSPIILSPFLGESPAGGRARLELALRELPDREWTPAAFLEAFARGRAEPGYGGFLRIVDHVRDCAETAGDAISPSECVLRIDRLLEACGWPGAGPLDSAAFQLVNRWRALQNEFAHVERVVARTTFPDAVRRIESMATETLWQPESGSGAVQVLGPLEAAGMSFDALWVAGMDAGQWPPPARPAPFVSIGLQRTRRMPDATPDDTLDYARRILERLVGSAPECVLSWSRVVDDTEQVSSPLLADIAAEHYSGPADPGWYAATLAGHQPMEQLCGDQIRPVATGERVWGGAYTAQCQFREPFSAMVFGRFGVRRPEPFVSGLSASLRGRIIHRALHGLLSEKPSLGAMRSWSDAERSRRIGAAVDSALSEEVRSTDAVLAGLLGLERERVRRILVDFIQSECERDPDVRIFAVELPVEYEYGALKLGFRIDRVDELPDGKLMVIDYKTGTPRHFLRRTDELRDIQPVLYADALDRPVAGLAFLNIDSRAILWRRAIADPGDEDDRFDERLAAWRDAARKTVAGLASGDVRINLRFSAAESRPLAILSRIEEHRRGR